MFPVRKQSFRIFGGCFSKTEDFFLIRLSSFVHVQGKYGERGDRTVKSFLSLRVCCFRSACITCSVQYRRPAFPAGLHVCDRYPCVFGESALAGDNSGFLLLLPPGLLTNSCTDLPTQLRQEESIYCTRGGFMFAVQTCWRGRKRSRRRWWREFQKYFYNPDFLLR